MALANPPSILAFLCIEAPGGKAGANMSYWKKRRPAGPTQKRRDLLAEAVSLDRGGGERGSNRRRQHGGTCRPRRNRLDRTDGGHCHLGRRRGHGHALRGGRLMQP